MSVEKRPFTVGSSDKLLRLKSEQKTRFTEARSNASTSSVGSDIKARHRRVYDDQNTNSNTAASSLNLKSRLLEDAMMEVAGNAPTPPFSPATATANASHTQTSAMLLLQHERAQQELRNAKSLALLRSKDQVIAGLEARCAEATAGTASLRSQLETSQLQYEETRDRMEDLIQEKSALKKELHAVVQEAAAWHQVAHRHEEARQKVDQLSAEVEQSKGQISTLTTALEASDALLDELQRNVDRHLVERQVAEKEKEEIRGHLMRLLGPPCFHATISRRMEEGGGDEEVAGLREANAVLEKAVVEAHLKLAGVDVGSHDSYESILTELSEDSEKRKKNATTATNTYSVIGSEKTTELVHLCKEIAALRDTLAIVEENNAQLETASAVAQRAALHAESTLQSTLHHKQRLVQESTELKNEVKNAVKRAEVAEGLCVELEKEKGGLAATVQAGAVDRRRLEEECNAWEKRAIEAESKICEATERAEVAEEEAINAKEQAESQVGAALRQCSGLQTLASEAEAENEELKRQLKDTEDELSVAVAKIAAQEAAEQMCTMKAVGRGSAVGGGGEDRVQVLATYLAESAERQLELYRELRTVQESNAKYEAQYQRGQQSLCRLRRAIALGGFGYADDDDDVRTTTKIKPPSPPPPPSSLQVVQLLAAQQGQASAFASLIDEYTSRLSDAQFVNEELNRVTNLVTAAVAALHGVLAQVASMEGREDAGDALLHADVGVDDLGQAVAAVCAKVLELCCQRSTPSGGGGGDGSCSKTSSTKTKDKEREEAHAKAAKAAIAAADAMEKQIERMAEDMTLMNERISVLTAANEAAQAEYSHAKSSVEQLAEALRAARVTYEGKEGAMQEALAVARNERKRLEMEVETLEKERTSWIAGHEQQQQSKKEHVEEVVEEEGAGSERNMPSGLGDLLDGVENVLQDAAAMEARIKELEALVGEYEAKETENNESYRQQQQQQQQIGLKFGMMAYGVQRTKALAKAWMEEQAQREEERRTTAALQATVSRLEHEREELLQRLEAARQAHEKQLEHAANYYASEVASLQAESQGQRRDAQRYMEAATAAAAAAGEEMARKEVEHSVLSARRALEQVQRRCSLLAAERDAVVMEFEKYKELKGAEIQLLERRLPVLLGASNRGVNSSNNDAEVASAAGRIAAACRSDAVTAAMREAKLERAHRMQVQLALDEAVVAEKKATLAMAAADQELSQLRGVEQDVEG